MNRGENTGVFFVRDRQGTEGDLVVDQGGRLRVVEVKAGHTATRDMLQQAGKAARLLAPVAPAESLLVYGGDIPQARGDVTVVPWDEVDRLNWVEPRPTGN